MSAALQLGNPREGEAADWVVGYRLIHRIPLNCEPTRVEIRLAVWYLLDHGCGIRDIATRTGLDRSVVSGVQDLRKRSAWSTKRGTPDRRRRARRARAARPHWQHLRLLGSVA